MRGKKLTEEQINAVVKLFPNHTKRELHDMTGVGYSSIDRIQTAYHLHKSQKHLHDMGVRAGKASHLARGGDSSSCYTPEAIAKKVATWKKTYQLENMRVRWGLPQLTRMRLKHAPVELRDQAAYLRSLGYVVDGKNRVAYYKPDTHRATRLEKLKRGEVKGSYHCFFDFKPIES